MTTYADETLLELIRDAARPVQGKPENYDRLIKAIGNAQIVLIGEATHGTHEFYRDRALITRRLIEEKDFAAVAVEADWPDSYEVNRFVRGHGDYTSATDALDGFKRFPTWMWRNTDVLHFINWLREFNLNRPSEKKAGFYGLDLYSLFTSSQAVIAYLEQVDLRAAQEAKRRYECFDQFDRDLQNYGFMASFGLEEDCENAVVEQLIELQRYAMSYTRQAADRDGEAFFNATQNARLARNAEQYYRAMFQGRVASWNLRDTHMFETLNELRNFLGRDREAKIVIWAHNSHLGDARATEMGWMGELNLGQLVRQQFREQAFNIGFSTYTGTVTAASDWDAPAERKYVRPALPGSYELLFHEAGIPACYLLLQEDRRLRQAFEKPRLQRAIGVIYAPRTERQSHYFEAKLSNQFDAIIHYDRTEALHPLERTTAWERGEEVPETFPSSL